MTESQAFGHMSKGIWWVEDYFSGRGLVAYQIEKFLFDEQSDYQRVRIFDTKDYGRVFTLDDLMMTNELDEFAYHEMLVHIPLLAHPNPEKVLIIGGGDGGSLREATKHPSVKEARLCEIDGMVVEAAKQYLHYTNAGFNHPSSIVTIGDGIEFVRQHPNSYDVILIDSTDPVGPAEALFAEAFYNDVLTCLRPGGIVAQQTESPYFTPQSVKMIYSILHKVFPHVHTYMSMIPGYPSGAWSFSLVSKDVETPTQHFNSQRVKALGDLKYYVPEMQQSAFVLPAFVQKLVKGE